jgi:hypothetical protein
MTPQELTAAEAAEDSYWGFEDAFIPRGAIEGMAECVGEAADAATPQTAPARFAAGQAALMAEAIKSGHGDQMTQTMSAAITTAVLVAVAQVRAQIKQAKR